MHARVVLSCLERCPQFRSVLIEREVPLYSIHIIDTSHNTLGFLPVGWSVYEAFAAGPMSQLSVCYHPPMQDCTKRDYSKIRTFEVLNSTHQSL